jgi:hypothetical protein
VLQIAGPARKLVVAQKSQTCSVKVTDKNYKIYDFLKA